jgi:hypothetical protein
MSILEHHVLGCNRSIFIGKKFLWSFPKQMSYLHGASSHVWLTDFGSTRFAILQPDLAIVLVKVSLTIHSYL